MRKVYTTALITVMITLTSCTHFIAHTIIKNPKVYDISQQQVYWYQKNTTPQPYFYLAIKANEFTDSLYKKVDVTGPLIFNQDGYKLIYNGEESCGAIIMSSFLNGDLSLFDIDSSNKNFDYYAQRIKDHNNQVIDPKIVIDKKYTILNGWNRYMAPKYWIRDQINWIDSQIVAQQLDHIQFLKVNNDFLVENGYKKGKKGKIKRHIDHNRMLKLTLVRPPKSN